MFNKFKFLKRSHCQDYDLVQNFTNKNANSSLKNIHVHEQLSPYTLGQNMLHKERVITVTTNSASFFRMDNTFLNKTRIGYEIEGKHESQEMPSYSNKKQCQQLIDFFKSKGLDSGNDLTVLCTTIDQDLEAELIKMGHDIEPARAKI